jgi:hypothetical protein
MAKKNVHVVPKGFPGPPSTPERPHPFLLLPQTPSWQCLTGIADPDGTAAVGSVERRSLEIVATVESAAGSGDDR